MANSLYDNNANKDGELSPVTPAMVLPSLQYPVEGICDTILYLGENFFIEYFVILVFLVFLSAYFIPSF